MENTILKIDHLTKTFTSKGDFFHQEKVHAVNGVSFEVARMEIFGIVGESGCGKTTIARCILGLERPTDGRIWFQNDEIGHLSPTQFRPYRKKLQMVFQDPTDSLNPRLSVKQTLMEPLDLFTSLSNAEKLELINETLSIVGLRPEHLASYPHQLSTGQQQRIGIARATICKPEFVVLDEPTSALDLSFQGRILELLLDFRERNGITYIFVSHDLGVVRYFCNLTAVMYLGFIVEVGNSKELFQNPIHPYTNALVSAIPKIDPKSRKQRTILKGEVPSPLNIPKGCAFSNRCPEAVSVCFETRPALEPISNGRSVACHRVNQR